MKPRLLLVLGMHRSGTSVVARSLECLGGALGPFATWGAPDNPDFAEDQQVLGIDEQLLRRNGLAWDAPSVPWLFDRTLQLLARAVLRDRLASLPFYVLKEPRMCRLLPFWRPVFAAQCAVSVVEVVRHPNAVCASLWRRNRIEREHGLALWLDHVHRYCADADGDWPWVTVEYDRFVADPHEHLSRIGHALGLALSPTAVPPVDPALRHWRVIDERLPDEVAAGWENALARIGA